MVYGTRFEIGRGVILTVGSNPTLSAILLITNSLCVFMGIHGLFWVGGFTVFRMLCHLDAAFCVECV